MQNIFHSNAPKYRMKKSPSGWGYSFVFLFLVLLGGNNIVNINDVVEVLIGSSVFGWTTYLIVSAFRKKGILWVYVDGVGREVPIEENKLISLIKRKQLPENTKFKPSNSNEWKILTYSDALINALESSNEEHSAKKSILKATSSIIFLMLIFPPYIVTNYNGVAIMSGYGFLFRLPDYITDSGSRISSDVNIYVLLLEIFAALIIGSLLYMANKE